MDDSSSISGTNASVEFYLPSTFQFGRGPGRIERLLVRAFGRHDDGERSLVQPSGREFYLPGTPDVRPARGR